MHLSFNLLRVKGLYMFRALLAHSQGALYEQYLVYCVRIISVGCYQDWRGTPSRRTQLTYPARSTPSAVWVAPPANDQVRLETCRGPWFSINWMKFVSRWFHYTAWFTSFEKKNVSRCFYTHKQTRAVFRRFWQTHNCFVWSVKQSCIWFCSHPILKLSTPWIFTINQLFLFHINEHKGGYTLEPLQRTVTP
jgi:hypothetical protein